MKKRERGIHEMFAQDPERADWEAWGRRTNHVTRRGFVSGLAAFSAFVGARVPFAHAAPQGLIPASHSNSDAAFQIEGKDGLILLNDRPVNAETPPHLLNDDVTPANRLFIRNYGEPPENVNSSTWSLAFEGESVGAYKTYTITNLKERFENISRQLVLECGGNGRAEFDPPVSGNQWSLGAVGCPLWNGVRLKDVLKDVGYKPDAVYVAFYGADSHMSGDAERVTISRGVPLDKALDDESMIVWGMNGDDLHPMNGHPLRLVFGGWPGSVSGKWLRRVTIRNKVHDGPKMESPSYRVPKTPVAPGTTVADEDMRIIHAMPVKSLITFPKTGVQIGTNDTLKVRGHAWAGDNSVRSLNVSIDFGQTWSAANLKPAVNRLAWQHWDHSIKFPTTGYYEVWARAEDDQGHSQPMVLPNWNPKGYLNNACHRIAIYVS
ncbi:MAG: sulfite oxidase [Gammaproteobacteria bacterium]|nr:sulfite oxidase [Gammaproteobacteria bacterium]MYC26089.1 sulfite oxidase [Gammaproteobacteria bacterium]